MQKDRLLKQVTVCSVLLLCFTLVFAYRNQIQLQAESVGTKLEATPTPTVLPTPTALAATPAPTPTLTPTPLPLPTPTFIPVPTEPAVSGAWAKVRGAQESELVQHLATEGITTIVIEKREEGYAGASILLEDIAVERQLSVTIRNITSEEFSTEQVYRISQETFYKGDPPTPTPTATPTPTSSVRVTPTPKPSVTPTMTPVPTLSPEDPLYPWRHDPVKKLEVATWGNEDDTMDVTLLFTLDKAYVYELSEDENNYYISLFRPKDVYDRIIVIDAGHGGYDPGTLSKDEIYLEKDINLNIVLYLKEMLDVESAIKVYYTRVTDKRLNLTQRVRLANDVEADFFLSVHCNSSESKWMNGTEVLYSAAQNAWTGMNSKRFAQICMDQLDQYLGLKNRGLIARDHNVTIIKEAKVPVALVETAFMSYASDMKTLAKEETQRNIAKALYEAIMEGYRQLEAEKEAGKE